MDKGATADGQPEGEQDRKGTDMSNLHDLEQLVIERRREIDARLKHDAMVRQLSVSAPTRGYADRRPALRIRFGLLLIRLGGRLAA